MVNFESEKNYNFFQITFIYLTTRLFTNMSQVYIPLYLQVKAFKTSKLADY